MTQLSINKTKTIRPSKLLGQHFLRNQRVVREIIHTADLSSKDIVLEVGPGHGELTFELAKKAKQVLAVEKDKRLVEELKKKVLGLKNIKIIQEDILKMIDKLTKKLPNYKLIANIPYYLTSRLIKNFLEAENPPKLMVLMLQKEVAKRICSKPPKMSLLAVSVQVYAQPKIIQYVSKRSFWPQPKVDSAIIEIKPLPQIGHRLDTDKTQITDFFKLVKAGFSAPRKQLINNLSKKLKISRQEVAQKIKQCGLNPKQRAETLSVENWQKLSTAFFS